ncbi:MAG TPA: translocase [Planctomycetaceae bacterium]|nr:translocase [Planctomycetaceae bacterium]
MASRLDSYLPGRLARWRRLAGQVVARSDALSGLSADELLKRGLELRWQARSGIDLRRLMLEAFALIRESSRRTIGMAHYPVQVMGAIAIFEGGLAEMQTGEGKTLTAVMPTFLRALPGRGCHVVTVNDYLAQRDADWMRPAYELVGLSVGCIQTPQSTDERRCEYSRDITYGTAKELGFDFLRDRLRLDSAKVGIEDELPVQREHYFALVDEADSVLIDDARTPLIISMTEPNRPAMVELYRWCAVFAPTLTLPNDFEYDPHKREAVLTEVGCRHVLLARKPPVVAAIEPEQLYRQVERALTAQYGFIRDRDYVIHDDEVIIVDESTGRMTEGRKWQQGLHQAIEAKENIVITPRTLAAAQVTVQRFFRQYAHVGGMTGTAVAVRREMRRTYRMLVTAIPTHRPTIRTRLPSRVFATWDAKAAAIADEIETMLSHGRSVLVGTPSIEASERLSRTLTERALVHQVLNARFLKEEAAIVSQAGRTGHVTIATNMAGRGTDIILDDDVRRQGGLHVVATEIHSSARIDRQLVGRCARQGDPGSYRFFLSLEDELLRCLAPAKLGQIRARAASLGRSELPDEFLAIFYRAQRLLERLHIRHRKLLLKFEDQRFRSHRQMGLDPFLELIEEQ